jgi:transcriptional regulator with GAF, ATPase, and Fis domain
VDDNERWSRLLAEAAIERALQPQRICQLCVSILGMSGAGIGIVTESGNRGSVCTTDEVAARIEELQFTLGEGPCVDAVLSGTPVLIADLHEQSDFDAERWPAFMEGARAAGVRGVFAFPLRIGAITVGALDLYCEEPGDLDSYQLRALLMAADAAALALLHLDTSDDAFADDPDAGTTYQLQVHQATGMVQVQLDVTTEEAFLMLRARAFSLGRPLASVATDVVQRRLRFTKEDS